MSPFSDYRRRKIVIYFTASTILRAEVCAPCMAVRATRCRLIGHLDFQAIVVALRAILKKVPVRRWVG